MDVGDGKGGGRGGNVITLCSDHKMLTMHNGTGAYPPPPGLADTPKFLTRVGRGRGDGGGETIGGARDAHMPFFHCADR